MASIDGVDGSTTLTAVGGKGYFLDTNRGYRSIFQVP